MIVWSSWSYKNKVIFNEFKATPANVINLVVSCLNEMKS